MLGQFPDAPADLLVSIEADVFTFRNADDAELIEGSIGEGSPFHQTFGYCAHGQFPDKLDALVPSFIAKLPHDVITGEPYKYRRTDDGRFVLYSVGWNEKDDGGVPGKTDFDENDGDWVWQYPQL